MKWCYYKICILNRHANSPNVETTSHNSYKGGILDIRGFVYIVACLCVDVFELKCSLRTFAFDVRKVVSGPLSIPTIFPFFTMMDPDEMQSGSNIFLPFMIKNSSASAIFAS